MLEAAPVLGVSVLCSYLFVIAEGWKIASSSYGQDVFRDRVRPRGMLGYFEILFENNGLRGSATKFLSANASMCLSLAEVAMKNT